MAIRTIQQLLDKFVPGDSPRSADYVDLIETLADDRNAVYFSATAPEDISANPIWFDTENEVLFIYSNNDWIGVGGEQSVAGDSAYQVAVDNGFAGTESQWLDSLVGSTGPEGPKGDTGLAGTTDYEQLDNLPDLSVYATQSYADSAAATAVAAAIDSAPSTLDTLNELAAAINDDSSFASTVTTALGTKAPIESPTFTGTVSGITKSMVGLPNVDNTADTEKPVSTAQQTALNLKANLSGPTFTGTTTINAIADATTTTASRGAGYMGVPKSAAATTGSYTIVGADAGEHIYSTATRTVTIPANASVAFPVGTAITFIAAAGATVTIAITTDTLLLAGAGTTGPRTLAPFGMATAIKITSTSWIISGNGLR
jgi:hypothetical protein